MATTQTLDEAKVEAFMGKVLGDLGGTMAMLLAHLGDRLGLFKELADRGPATPAELATRAHVDERYAAEWLLGLTSAGYLDYDRGTGRYSLPPEHALALAQEGGPFFVGGAFEMLPEFVRPIDELAEAFRSGGGVSQAAFDPRIWEGMERFTAGWFENHLVQEWIPALPEVQAKLEAGATLADVGCGSGRAVIKLALAFPSSHFVGYDAFQGQVDRARENIDHAGLADRVRIELLDVAAGLPEEFDLITTFDVVHDAVDPQGLLRAIRNSLAPGGIYLVLEINTADDPHENVGPIATMYYGASVFYCMTTSLAHGGAGLGTHGLPEARLRELCLEAGFTSVRRTPIEDPFDILYEVKA
jgi:2-polyprenyl-3-methyl-5-hydroxy-6-metoxy-1,4-benzoquinol methylase